MTQIIVYLRVSTDEQAQSGLGLEAQLAQCEAVASPDQVFTDDGYSGAKADRPALLAALAALGKGDVLMVAKRDRLARDPMLMGWVEKECKKVGARVVSAAGEGTENDDPTSILMRRMVDAFAEFERLQIGARTKAALGAKRARGEKTGGDVPYGFTVDSQGQLSEDGNEQEALSIIRRLRGNGWTLQAICDELASRGIKTKRGGIKWQPKVVARLAKAA
jgi:DNA invertase Pin-like site-specific DNA recombinase|tara:strand:- start:511 stop:1170 length:660 start_codon:yes stop_codon:yes gene_type:complete